MSTNQDEHKAMTVMSEALPTPLLEEFEIIELEERLELEGRCNDNCSCPGGGKKPG